MRYTLHDPWIRCWFAGWRRGWWLGAQLVVAKKLVDWLRSRPTAFYRQFQAGRWLLVDGPRNAVITILFVPGQTELAYGRFNATF
jgi:hypothetical protein